MVKQLKSFLAKVYYIRRFTPALEELLEPFQELIKKDVSFNWMDKQEAAFQRIKNVLGSSPTMVSLIRGLTLTLYLNSTNKSIGALLVHEV